MPNFVYKAVDAKGAITNGKMAGNSDRDVITFLRQEGQYPIDVHEEGKSSVLAKDIQIGSGKVKKVHVIVFCRQLAAMLKAGMPLDRALTTQQGQTEDKTMRVAVAKLTALVKQGNTMSDAMAEQPNAFPEILARSVAAGERTGNLDTSLLQMGNHFHRMDAITRKAKGAMMYPIACLTLTFAIAAFLIVWAVPQFAENLSDQGGELPGITQFFVNISDSIQNWWYIYIGIIVLFVVLLRTWLSTEGGKRIAGKLVLSLPKIKTLVKQILTAKFSRTFSSMVACGLSIIDALELAVDSMDNRYAEIKTKAVVPEIREGTAVSICLRRTEVFPEMMLSMLAVGEETGSIDEMLESVSEYYDEESMAAIDKLLALINPIMILVLAVVVGSIALAIYMPMLEAITTAI